MQLFIVFGLFVINLASFDRLYTSVCCSIVAIGVPINSFKPMRFRVFILMFDVLIIAMFCVISIEEYIEKGIRIAGRKICRFRPNAEANYHEDDIIIKIYILSLRLSLSNDNAYLNTLKNSFF